MRSMVRRAAVAAVGLAFSAPAVALAHDAPEGADWLMADWMLFSFLAFFLAALVVFMVALRRGMLTNLEDAKFHILTIDEPDYYTPEWAKEETDASER